MTSLDTFAATLNPGDFVPFPAPSLTTPYDGTSRIFEPSMAAKAAALAGGWSAVHMADWWSRLAWDEATDTYWIAGGRDRLQPLAQNLVRYSAADDAWTQRPAWSGFQGGHCYQQTAAGGGKVYAITSGGIGVWNQATDSLEGFIPNAPSNVVSGFTSSLAAGGGIAYVPWLGSAGSVLAVNCNAHGTDPTRGLSRIFRRDLATNQWVGILGQRGLWNNQHTIVVSSRHADAALVGSTRAGQQRALGVLTASGLTLLPVGPMNCSTAGDNAQRALVFEHPDRNEWIIGCLSTQKFWSLPSGASAWVDRGPLPTALVSPNSVVLQTRFGAMFVRYGSTSQAWAWKPGF